MTKLFTPDHFSALLPLLRCQFPSRDFWSLPWSGLELARLIPGLALKEIPIFPRTTRITLFSDIFSFREHIQDPLPKEQPVDVVCVFREYNVLVAQLVMFLLQPCEPSNCSQTVCAGQLVIGKPFLCHQSRLLHHHDSALVARHLHRSRLYFPFHQVRIQWDASEVLP